MYAYSFFYDLCADLSEKRLITTSQLFLLLIELYEIHEFQPVAYVMMMMYVYPELERAILILSGLILWKI